MSRVFIALVLGFLAVQGQAQVRCKMPNGAWIERKLSDMCPTGATQAQSLDGKPLPLKLPPVAQPAAPATTQPVPVPAPPALPQSVGVDSSRQRMPFDACVRLMTQTVLAVGGGNTRVVMTAPNLRMLRVCTVDGSVLMTCSQADGSMVTTQSPHACN